MSGPVDSPKSTADCEWFALLNSAKQWEVNIRPYDYSQTVATIGLCTYIDVEPERIARLIAEAGTVLHETGKTPRQLADEVEEESAIRERMAELLAGAIVAIRGPETAGTRWGYHDLPERCAELVADRSRLADEVARLRQQATYETNVAAEALAEVERLTRGRSWLPISTAPHGVLVIVWCEGAEQAGLAWKCDGGVWHMPEPQAIGDQSLTHWMPLPCAPAALAEQQTAGGRA